ncbi:hypothetical protein GCM10022197_08390 [Microlunatus spumicola]|uniref:Pyridoxamine 5'-phosphate oxidase n=1 Tax=Microlunatus spumicola TaxID=81499 RepID=A0ABP6WVY9_9ACTN
MRPPGTRRRPPPPPRSIDGTVTADLADVGRLAWLVERGFVVAATTTGNPAGTRVACALAAGAFWPLLPAALALQTALTVRPGTRYYLTPARDAVLAVAVRRGGWFVFCHVAERPGSGQGRALRALVAPALCAAADASGTPIEAAALTSRLARRYQAEFPGLADQGRAFPQGRRLRRAPRP